MRQNLVDNLSSSVSPLEYTCLLVLEIVVELLMAAYVADFISGSVHFYLDYGPISNRELRLHVEPDSAAVIAFKETNKLYLEASLSDRFLWNTQHHHEVPYPPTDSWYEQFMQGLRPSAPFLVAFICLWGFGVMPNWFARILIIGVLLGLLAPFTHQAAHARVRGLLESSRAGRILAWMQDHHIIIHHETHRNHHIKFDCDFCLFNGWANPLFNLLQRFGTAIALFPTEPPTVTNRKENEELAARQASEKVTVETTSTAAQPALEMV